MRSRAGGTTGGDEGSGTGPPAAARRASTSKGLLRTFVASATCCADAEAVCDTGTADAGGEGSGSVALTQAGQPERDETSAMKAGGEAQIELIACSPRHERLDPEYVHVIGIKPSIVATDVRITDAGNRLRGQ